MIVTTTTPNSLTECYVNQATESSEDQMLRAVKYLKQRDVMWQLHENSEQLH